MDKKDTLKEKPVKKVAETSEEPRTKKVTRLRNSDIVELIEGLHGSVTKERNLRTVRENVIERENAFQLDGIIQKLKALALSFKLFISPPRAQ